MQLDRLLLEREGLLLEQHVVLLQFVLRQPLRALRAHQILAQLRYSSALSNVAAVVTSATW